MVLRPTSVVVSPSHSTQSFRKLDLLVDFLILLVCPLSGCHQDVTPTVKPTSNQPVSEFNQDQSTRSTGPTEREETPTLEANQTGSDSPQTAANHSTASHANANQAGASHAGEGTNQAAAGSKDHREVAETKTAGGTAVGSGRKSRPMKPVPDVGSTVRRVDQLVNDMRQAKGRKDYGQAFQLGTQAWDAARLHPTEPQLSRQVEELTAELAEIGELANAGYRTSANSRYTKLIEK